MGGAYGSGIRYEEGYYAALTSHAGERDAIPKAVSSALQVHAWSIQKDDRRAISTRTDRSRRATGVGLFEPQEESRPAQGVRDHACRAADRRHSRAEPAV